MRLGRLHPLLVRAGPRIPFVFAVALIAFGVAPLAGVLRAAGPVGGLGDLWVAAYGLVLVFKSGGVLVVLVVSALGWGRGLAVARLEGGVGVIVVGDSALLAAFPLL